MKRTLAGLALSLFAASAAAGTYVISTNADSGPGSLRQGILDANSGACSSPCRINFGSRNLMTVELLTPLPDITADGVGIGPEPPAYAWSLEISGKKLTSGSGLHFRGSRGGVGAVIINGFPGSGVVIEDTSSVTVGGCVIGLDATGTRAVPNGQNGVTIVHGHNISVDTSTIGGNIGNGIYVVGATDVFFGLDVIGKQYLPRGGGEISLPNGGSGIVLVDVQRAQFLGNTIVNNALAGVVIANTTGARVEDIGLPTVIYNNGLLAIDIGFDGVTEPRPVVALAEISNGFMRVKGEIRTTPVTTVAVNIFGSDTTAAFGTADAKKALSAANVKSDADGLATFEIRFAMQTDLRGQWLSASATTMAGGSQELSAPIRAVVNNQNFTVVNANDSGAGSLRQAILDANASPCAADFPCLINFGSDIHVIAPLSPLPPITRSGIALDGQNTVTIDGSRSSAGAGLTIAAATENVLAPSIRRITVTGFRGDGVVIDATQGFQLLNPVVFNSTIAGNIGAGIRVRGNVPFVHNGTFSSGNRLVSNVIRDNNSHGVALEGGFFELDANTIRSNGGSGVYIESAARAHLERNTIAFNTQSGVSTASTDPIAFKGVIQNSIHSNLGTAIELREGFQTAAENVLQTPPEITSATCDPTAATLTCTITGFYTRVAQTNGWSPVLDFATSTFPEIGGRGSMETPLYVNYTSKDEGNGRYSFRETTLQTDLRGKRISATATPFVFEGFKGPPQDNIFGQGFVYGTTSEVSKAVPVVTSGCTADLPQLGAAIATGTAVSFNWSAVTGATGYNIWLRKTPGTPQIIGSAIGTATTVTVGPGQYEWFVEATFSGCPAMKSEAALLEVAGGRHRAGGR
jgi:hypothetical protein